MCSYVLKLCGIGLAVIAWGMPQLPKLVCVGMVRVPDLDVVACAVYGTACRCMRSCCFLKHGPILM